MHKTKQKRNSLVLDSRGRRKFRLKPANLVAFKLSVFESRRISFLKIFLVSINFIKVLSYYRCICYLVFPALFPSISMVFIDYTCITPVR